ncbi:MAG: metallophosphoesterase family protein [Planctomycetota bacterium]|jgi:hypothetical protein
MSRNLPVISVLALLLAAGPAHGEPQSALTVAVISDLNGSYGSTEYSSHVRTAIARIIEIKPDLVLSTGDMVAGQKAGLDYVAMWAAFHENVSDPLAKAGIPFAVTPGNHDASGYPVFREEREIYAQQWGPRKPRLRYVEDKDFPLRYSFQAGPALFVSLDDTTTGKLPAAQIQWLERQLKAGRRAKVKVVFGHVPLYPFAKGREKDFIGDAALEALLNRYGVTLFLSGHHHAYFPGRRGPLRLVGMGCLGSGPRPLLGTTERSPRSFVLLQITKKGITHLEAYGGRGFTDVIARETLPPSVGKGAHVIERDDQAVTPKRR